MARVALRRTKVVVTGRIYRFFLYQSHTRKGVALVFLPIPRYNDKPSSVMPSKANNQANLTKRIARWTRFGRLNAWLRQAQCDERLYIALVAAHQTEHNKQSSKLYKRYRKMDTSASSV